MLLDDLRDVIRRKHYSIKTEKTYADWVKRFILFNKKRHPKDMGEIELGNYLTFLANENCSAATQDQAKHAILFMYRELLGRELQNIQSLRSQKEVRLPVALTVSEVKSIMCRLQGVYHIIAQLLYGGGLRLMECMRLRVKDVDFDRQIITLRDTKSHRDRVTVLPASVIQPLKLHLASVKALHDQDLANGFGSVSLPGRLAQKYRSADREWGWQYIFPAGQLTRDPRTNVIRRHHLYETSVQKNIRAAAKEAEIIKPVGPHTLRHAFATHLYESGVDIVKIQKLLGHKDVKTTMKYIHIGTISAGVKSPMDSLILSDSVGL